MTKFNNTLPGDYKKMSTSKKNVKKSTQVSKPLPFNKTNATAFGQAIYSEEGNNITFTRLCDGSLEDKNGNKPVHCAVGEAYFQFVSRNLKLKSELKLDGGDSEYESKYDATAKYDDSATKLAIDSLVDVAALKSDSRASKKRLATALSLCVMSNDDVENDGGDSVAEYLDRARDVQQTWKRRVLPLLK
jgi:hypothetical protein